MPFEKGNNLGIGGAKPGAGRPSKSELIIRKTAAEKVKQILERKASILAKHYLTRALGEQGDRVLCHAIDKLLPPVKNEQPDQSPRSAVFIQFNSNTSQLPSTTVSTTVLADDGNGQDKECSDGMAPKIGQRQDGLKFLDFKDVPGKRR